MKFFVIVCLLNAILLHLAGHHTVGEMYEVAAYVGIGINLIRTIVKTRAKNERNQPTA